MDLSLFLAQVFGLYFIIAGVAMLLRPKLVTDLIEMVTAHDGLLSLSGFVALIIGIPLVLLHSVWDGPVWQTVVSLVAWLTFLKGMSLILMPKLTIGWAEKIWRKQSTLNVLLVVMIMLGGYLAYVGFGM